MKKIYVLMAEGFEEMELVITVDVLRRAGLGVQTVTLNADAAPVVGSRGIAMVPDVTFNALEADSAQMVVLPGGLGGSERLGKDARVADLVRSFAQKNKWVAAICAAPTVLASLGLAEKRRMTAFPGIEEGMKGAIFCQNRVVIDPPFVTSRSAGTSFEFAFALVELLCGPEKVKEVNQGVFAILPDQMPLLMA
jgi:4-methyl-5(b-hydroxyethyl)-thiazole monophosphate biosynthesis